MKKELENIFAKATFAFTIFAAVFTTLELNLAMVILGISFGVLGIVFGIICLIKEFKYTGKIEIIISISTILISLVFLWMNLIK